MDNKLKKCATCTLELPKDDKHFASRYDRGKPEFQSNCRECQKYYRRKHYLKNKQKYIDKSRDYRLAFVKWFTEYKKELNCGVCGDDRYWVLDFHHKTPEEKDGEVSKIIRECNKTKLLDEVKKCSVLCANCHRDLHYKERQNKITQK